ncbi:MAG: hypothetical protein ACRD16_16075 [Thermoanaerobaculia bacterium]
MTARAVLPAVVLLSILVGSGLGRAADTETERLAERAHQDRTIVYFLRDPETHAFDLYHDYTESEVGKDKYVNVVRKGSRASNPAARILDTGAALKVETLRGSEIQKAGVDIGEPVVADSEIVLVRFPAVHKGRSVRLRISETYTDPKSYRLDGAELVFDRSFGRPRNAVVLPAGWYLTANSIPAGISETEDGRIRLDFVNPRNDEIAVLIRAARRQPRK